MPTERLREKALPTTRGRAPLPTTMPAPSVLTTRLPSIRGSLSPITPMPPSPRTSIALSAIVPEAPSMKIAVWWRPATVLPRTVGRAPSRIEIAVITAPSPPSKLLSSMTLRERSPSTTTPAMALALNAFPSMRPCPPSCTNTPEAVPLLMRLPRTTGSPPAWIVMAALPLPSNSLSSIRPVAESNTPTAPAALPDMTLPRRTGSAPSRIETAARLSERMSLSSISTEPPCTSMPYQRPPPFWRSVRPAIRPPFAFHQKTSAPSASITMSARGPSPTISSALSIVMPPT